MKKKKVMLILSFLLLFSYASAVNFRNLGADELKKMLDGGQKVTVVDARTTLEYSQGHIPKAINIPPEKLKIIAGKLPKNKTGPLVFYCRGVG
jgi:rhodanese-related sulfurtransferase